MRLTTRVYGIHIADCVQTFVTCEYNITNCNNIHMNINIALLLYVQLLSELLALV